MKEKLAQALSEKTTKNKIPAKKDQTKSTQPAPKIGEKKAEVQHANVITKQIEGQSNSTNESSGKSDTN